MSLTNNLIAIPQLNSTGERPKYAVSAGELAAGGAFTTVDIILATFPAGAIMRTNRIKHRTAVVGPAISAATARLFWGPSGNLTGLGAGALDVFAAPGSTDGTHSITGVTPVAGDLEDPNLLVMRVTSTGANLSVITAGAIDAVVDVSDLAI